MPYQDFTASGTWTKPGDIDGDLVDVECIGAGAYGLSSSGPAAGGGGGAYAFTQAIDVSGSSSFSVTVGESGVAVDSYFSGGFEVLAKGATDEYGALASGCVYGTSAYSGGDGGQGGINYGDGGGGGGGAAGNGGGGSAGTQGTEFDPGAGGSGGSGGGTFLAGGPGGMGAFSGPGAQGGAYGGGGGGGSPGHGGEGPGRNGIVRVHWAVVSSGSGAGNGGGGPSMSGVGMSGKGHPLVPSLLGG